MELKLFHAKLPYVNKSNLSVDDVINELKSLENQITALESHNKEQKLIEENNYISYQKYQTSQDYKKLNFKEKMDYMAKDITLKSNIMFKDFDGQQRVISLVLGNPYGTSMRFAEDKRADLFEQYKQLENERLTLRDKSTGIAKLFHSKNDLNNMIDQIAKIECKLIGIIKSDEKIESLQRKILDHLYGSVNSFIYHITSSQQLYEYSHAHMGIIDKITDCVSSKKM